MTIVLAFIQLLATFNTAPPQAVQQLWTSFQACTAKLAAVWLIAFKPSTVALQGSLYGDSQLIRLHPDAVDPAQPSNFVEVVDTWTNLGPIIDLAVVDLERQGQGQVVTCSGKDHSASLRIVRNGIGMIEQAAVELPGMSILVLTSVPGLETCPAPRTNFASCSTL